MVRALAAALVVLAGCASDQSEQGGGGSGDGNGSSSDGSAGTAGSGSDGGMTNSGTGGGGVDLEFGDVRCVYFRETDTYQCYAAAGNTVTVAVPECYVDSHLAVSEQYDMGWTEVPPWPSNHCTTTGSTASWDIVRCIDWGDQSPLCYGLLGDMWTVVKPDCHVDTLLSGADWSEQPVWPSNFCSQTPPDTWDEVRCVKQTGEDWADCFGRYGDTWATAVVPPCWVDALLQDEYVDETEPWPDGACPEP